MPLSPKYKLVFIHIPKTGGTSIEEFFRENGGCLYWERKKQYNGHSIQHCTYQELKELGLVPEGYRIFTVIRHPYERFLSDYNYYRTLDRFDGDILSFAKKFFGEPEGFDNHNKSIFHFLEVNGKIPSEIDIIRIENLDKDLLEKFGIRLEKKMNVSGKFETIPSQEVKDLIYQNWKEDFETLNYTI